MKELNDWIVTNLKLTNEQVEALYTTNDDGEKTLSSEAISILDDAYKSKLDKIKIDQYSKGQKDKARKLEAILKSNNIEINSNKVEDVLSDYFTLNNGTEKEVKELSKDELFNHPLVKQRLKVEIEKFDSLKNEFDTYKSDSSLKEIRTIARTKAREVFLKSNPILSDNSEIREKQVQAYLNSIDYSKVKLEGDDLIPIDEDGSRLQDDKFNDIDFDSYALGFSFFESHKQDPSKTSTKTITSKVDTNNVPSFEKYEDVINYTRTEKDPLKVKAVVEKFKALQEN